MASAEEGSGNVSAVTQKSVVTAIRPKLVIPGESLEQELDSIEQRVRVGKLCYCVSANFHNQFPLFSGAGIQQHDGQVIASKAGVLRHQKPNRVWVEQSSRRVRCSILACCSEACSLDCYVQYIAKQEDPVIGVVVDMDRHAEGSYRISLHGTCDALLHKLAFDGASKKNKPDLQIGSAVYCRIASASKFVEPQLSCQVLSGPKKDWVTGEALFGELKGGLVTRCSSGLANK